MNSKTKRLKNYLTDAHAEFVRHDAYCDKCRQSSRYGANWREHLCCEGQRLFSALKDAERAASA